MFIFLLMYFYAFKRILQAKGKAFARPLFVPVTTLHGGSERNGAASAVYNPRINSGRSRRRSLRDNMAFNWCSTFFLSPGIVPRIA
jgi:hypothetical protein